MTTRLGIYVHLPFCRVRCSYCAFAISTDLGKEEQYVEALLREMEGRRVAGARMDTLYFGGGTPSKTAPSSLARIAQAARDYYGSDILEFTIEANPEDVTPDSIAAWRDIGASRLSIGVQSFHDAELFPLGRGHSRQLAIDAVSRAVDAGFHTNLDLIIGLPGQTRDSFRESMRTAASLGTGHLSIYMLDLEEGSVLEKQVRFGRVRIPEDEAIGTLYLDAIELAAQAGLEHYEISNFARRGERSLHNLKYWNREPYLGFGLGAHSQTGDERVANARGLQQYLDRIAEDGNALEFREELSSIEVRRERLFLDLRQAAGIEYAALLELCGTEGDEWTERGLAEGWLTKREGRVAFTPSGFLLSNSYISELF